MRDAFNGTLLWKQGKLRHLKAILENLGLVFWNSPTPALPILVGGKLKCYALW